MLTRRLKRGSALNIIFGAELRSLGLACGIIKVGPLRSRAAGDKEACKQKRHPHASLAFRLARPCSLSLGVRAPRWRAANEGKQGDCQAIALVRALTKSLIQQNA